MKARTLLIGTAFVLGVTGARAQWVVTDPGNLAQSIINMSDNIAHTSKTAVNTAESFAETVKIYEQAKKYYDQLKSVNNLIQDARKVRDIILMVGDGNDGCTACFPCFFKPRVAQFPCSHFDGDMPFLCFPLCVEMDGVQRHPVLQAELAYKVLVAVGFRSAQVEVAMGGFACVSQAEEQAQ